MEAEGAAAAVVTAGSMHFDWIQETNRHRWWEQIFMNNGRGRVAGASRARLIQAEGNLEWRVGGEWVLIDVVWPQMYVVGEGGTGVGPSRRVRWQRAGRGARRSDGWDWGQTNIRGEKEGGACESGRECGREGVRRQKGQM